MAQAKQKRIRDYGLTPGQLPPGPRNLISDVSSVTVGHLTRTGQNGSRTGLTITSPQPGNTFRHPLPAAVFVGNGFGKSVGLSQIAELGRLETPIALTNTHSVGPVMRGVVELVTTATPDIKPYESINAVVGETNDWILNDLHGQPLSPADVATAWSNQTADFELGAVGAGAGTRVFSFKGGIGSASRQVRANNRTYTIGTLVQTNFGGNLTIMGVPVGELLQIPDSASFAGNPPDGSCMIVIATDAPLSSRQLGRIAKRTLFGLARTGSIMATSSGDYSLAFSTKTASDASILSDNDLNPLFQGAIETTEESVYDALFTAKTTVGRAKNQLPALPVEQVVALIRKYRP